MGATMIKAAPLRLAHAAAATFDPSVSIALSPDTYSAAAVTVDPELAPPWPPRTLVISETAAAVRVLVKDQWGLVDMGPTRAAVKIELARLVREAENHADASVRTELAAIVREARPLGVFSTAGLVNMVALAVDTYLAPVDFDRAIHSLNPQPIPGSTEQTASLFLSRRISRWHADFATGSTQKLAIASTAGAILDASARSAPVAGLIELLDRRISGAHRVSAAAVMAAFFLVAVIAVAAALLFRNAHVASHRMTSATELIGAHRHAVITENGVVRGAYLPVSQTLAGSAGGASQHSPVVIAQSMRTLHI